MVKCRPIVPVLRVAPMDKSTRVLVEDTYDDTVSETISRGGSKLDAHKEGVVAAAMLFAALTGTEDESARREVVALNLRPA